MIFLSLLAKTLSLALAGPRPGAAVALWLLGLAADFGAAGKNRGLLGRVARALKWNFAALAVGFVVAAGGEYAAMRWKEGIPAFAAPVTWLLGVFGVDAGHREGVVFLTTMAGPLEFAASIDTLGLRVPFLFAAFSLLWLLWTGRPVIESLRRAGMVTGALVVLVVARMAAYVMLADAVFDFTGYESEELPYRPFMDETARVLLHLPFLLAVWVPLGRWLRWPEEAEEDAGETAATEGMVPKRRQAWVAAAAALALSAVVFWQPRGSLKTDNRHIVIAAGHAQWSQSARPYDRDWYGADSGYNYACMARLFRLFAPVRIADAPLTARHLADASVLIVYLPDRRFSSDELRLIQGFVREGGGLLVIGDHTNVFGSTSHLNELCEPFGFLIRDDVLFDLDDDFHQMLDAPRLASPAWHGMGFFKLRGPASIRPTSIWTRTDYRVGHSKSVRAIYSVNNFFPPPHDHPRMRSGDFCVAATARHGGGRVAAWADSTVFSNFEIFYPGKYEYLLNTMHWLSHRDSSLTALARRLALVLLAGGALFWLLRHRTPGVWFGTFTVLALALIGGRLAAHALERARTDFPVPEQGADWLTFFARSDDSRHNLRGFTAEGPYDERYEVFIQWVLRTGAMSGFHVTDSRRANGLFKHLRGVEGTRVASALIVRETADLATLRKLARVHGDSDAPVLLMFASAIPAEQAVDAMRRAGLLGAGGDAAAAVSAAWPEGEVSLEENGRRLMVVTGAERFSDQAMGITEKVVPDEALRAKFDEAFGVIDRLFDRSPPAGD